MLSDALAQTLYLFQLLWRGSCHYLRLFIRKDVALFVFGLGVIGVVIVLLFVLLDLDLLIAILIKGRLGLLQHRLKPDRLAVDIVAKQQPLILLLSITFLQL